MVSQTFDDRVDVYEVPLADAADARWRGSLGLDLDPNAGGDISGDKLDEPLDLAAGVGRLEVLVGHYPSREAGSLLRFDDDALRALPAGEVIETATWWRSGDPIAGASLVPLGVREPVTMLSLEAGRRIVGVFNNDLFEPESNWDGPAGLLIVDDDGRIGEVDVTQRLGGACRGGWGLTRLGPGTIAMACDGDEGVAVLDVSGTSVERAPEPAAAAAAVTGCFADIAFSEKRVRHLAPDGEGGVVVAESPALATGDDARIWHFDGACGLVSLGTLPGPEIWDLREMVLVPGTSPPRWLVARGRTSARGIEVLAEGDDGIERCGTLPGLDALLTGGTEVVDPVSLAVTSDGSGIAVGAGPSDYANAAPGHGRVGWIELDGADPCSAETEVFDLSAAAPAVDPGVPATWSRGPNEIIIVEP